MKLEDMTLDEINEQIAQIMQEKAEEQALAHYVAPRASSRFDYIINGDRSGLDKFDASEQAYATMLAKQRMADDEAYKQRVFNELSKEADRLNTLKIASAGKEGQAAYDRKRLLYNKELERDLLLAKRDEVDRVGGNTKEYDLKLNSIYKQFPELGTPTDVKAWDPVQSQSYLLNTYADYDDSYTQDELNEAIDKFKKYATTDEGAKRLAQLNKALKKRQKYDANAAQVKADLDTYARTGELSDLLVDLGWTVEGSVNNRYAQRNGKGNKTYFKGKGKGSKPKTVLK